MEVKEMITRGSEVTEGEYRMEIGQRLRETENMKQNSKHQDFKACNYYL